MTSSYDIFKTDTPPYFQVVVVCDTCRQRVKDCNCTFCENCDDDESCNCEVGLINPPHSKESC
jgi:hypothetical protein